MRIDIKYTVRESKSAVIIAGLGGFEDTLPVNISIKGNLR